MRIPQTPPTSDEIFTEVAQRDPAAIVRILRASRQPQSSYYHWDELRHRTPPDRISHREWWAGIKQGRETSARLLEGLQQTDGRPFTHNLADGVLQQLDLLTPRLSGQIAMSEQVTNQGTRDSYVVSSLIEEAITSSQLEGAVTTRRVAKEMLRSGRPPRDHSELMILNNHRAMQFISEHHDQDLTPELVCEIHRIVTEGTLDDPADAGRLQRPGDDRVSVRTFEDELLHTPPPAEQLPERLERLCTFANRTEPYLNPILRATTIHFMVGYDHYFADGNGRTARALFYWSLLHAGYWLAEFLTISTVIKARHAQYGRAYLYTETDGGDLTYFHLFHLKVLDAAWRRLDQHLTRKAEEISQTRHRLRAVPGEFNHRQLELVEHAVADPTETFSAHGHATRHRVSDETARQDLRDLESRGLLVRRKSGKRYVWVPADALAVRLQDDD
ncbi:Fic family protein [Propionibacteriaceae bacterium Y1685]